MILLAILIAIPVVVSAVVFIACCVVAGRADRIMDDDAVRRALYPND
jgi:hypothetical protein